MNPTNKNFDRRWWNREDIILLVLLGALLYLPGIYSIPLFDRDEPRFAVAARTMMQTGDYIVPKYNGMLRPDKPPLVYWLMDLGYFVTGGYSEFGARLPSAVCATLTLIVVYFMAGRRFGRIPGMLSATMLGTSVLFTVEGRLATADATMVLFIALCMEFAWRAWETAGEGNPAEVEGGGGGGGGGGGPGRLPVADYLPDRSGDRGALVLDTLAQNHARRRMTMGQALMFWVALAAGTLAKGVPLVFVFVPMIFLSLSTGALPGQLRRWRSHFHLTQRRVAAACVVLAAMGILLIVSTSVDWLSGMRAWVIGLGVLLIAMALTPGLPEILARCLFQANWSWWRALRPWIGFPVLIVLVGWWVVWAGIATHWVLIIDMVGNHFLNRVAGPLLNSLGVHIADTTGGGNQDPMRAYREPPGFFLLTVWGTFWPWSILLVPAGFFTWRRMRGKGPVDIDPSPYRFLFAWIVPMWVLLELSRGKLFHYPLPLFIPISILCADTLVQSWHRMTDVLAAPWFSAMRWITLVIWLGMGLALLFAARMNLDRDLFWHCFPFGVALMATGFVSAFTWGKISWPLVLAPCWAGTLLMLDALLLPSLPQLQVSPIAGAIMADFVKAHPGYHQGVCGYEDATLVFYSGGNVQTLDDVTLLKDVPFAPSKDPASDPYVIAVDAPTLRMLDAHGIEYTRLPRRDLPANLGQTEAFSIRGIRAANPFKSVTITVITNDFPQPAAGRTAETGEGTMRAGGTVESGPASAPQH